MDFTINLAKGFKKKPKDSKPDIVSKLCIGITIKEGDEYKIRVSLKNNSEYPNFIVIPFTKESLELKGKVIVYSHKKDKYGHYIAYYRDPYLCKLFPGLPSQYTAVRDKLICSGYVIRKDGKLMFDLTDYSTSLFQSNDEYNTD